MCLRGPEEHTVGDDDGSPTTLAFIGSPEIVTAMALARDNKTLVTGSKTGEIKVTRVHPCSAGNDITAMPAQRTISPK